jgi:hypothetical protein
MLASGNGVDPTSGCEKKEILDEKGHLEWNCSTRDCPYRLPTSSSKVDATVNIMRGEKRGDDSEGEVPPRIIACSDDARAEHVGLLRSFLTAKLDQMTTKSCG